MICKSNNTVLDPINWLTKSVEQSGLVYEIKGHLVAHKGPL